MTRASISELKARLSQYLDAVRAGEEVIVTDRGVPVARLAPVRGPEERESRMEWLIRTGRVRPPRDRLAEGFWELPRPPDPEGRALAALLEERESGR